MRFWLSILLRLVAGTYFVLTSLYCLLAFLPYTYCAFIKAPPYPWMPPFTHYQAGMYWIAAGMGVAANWPVKESWRKRDRSFLVGSGVFVGGGVYLSLRPFLSSLQSNRAAYWWSLAVLLPVAGLALWHPDGRKEGPAAAPRRQAFGYSTGLLIALAASTVYVLGARVRVYSESHTLGVHLQDAEIALWSFVSHLALAVAILSVLNLIFLIAERTPQPRMARRVIIGGVVVLTLWVVLSHFLDAAMSFDGRWAYVYAGAFSVTLTLWGFSLACPFLQPRNTNKAAEKASRAGTIATWAGVVVLTGLALASRWLIGGEDWNGFVASAWALIFWIAVSLCLFRLRPARAGYSAASIVGILLASAFLYKGLQATEIFWARALGSTDDEISLKFEDYGERDASFQLAHHVLGNSRSQACGDLCRILREYTNVRDTHIHAGVQLVDNLSPAQGERPNIFVFVVDAMRPDYLGAYNPRADYTPNLDALARDSVVFHHAYTQYAGTSLSEPAIWAGAMMLHAHFPEPFSSLNSLDRMLHTDNYRMLVSVDEVLALILPADDDMVKLDTDKKLWTRLELGSTLQQAEAVLDSHPDPGQPIFLYAQPKNVHQFAHNDVPSPTSQHWQSPTGMNARITYEVHWVDSCLGQFFRYLKQHGMYDNSIIIVSSDHGDATGEFGRTSHSTSIWPEIMRVPLIVHLPPQMRKRLVFDDNRISTVTDITPTLYYLLGHRPIRQNPLYGRPLFAETKQELDRYAGKDLLLASDVRAVYGILTSDERYLYTTYDSPAQSYLFDLTQDPNAEHSILTPQLKQRYDEEIIEHLHAIGDYYGYKPGVGSLLASARQ